MCTTLSDRLLLKQQCVTARRTFSPLQNNEPASLEYSCFLAFYTKLNCGSASIWGKKKTMYLATSGKPEFLPSFCSYHVSRGRTNSLVRETAQHRQLKTAFPLFCNRKTSALTLCSLLSCPQEYCNKLLHRDFVTVCA